MADGRRPFTAIVAGLLLFILATAVFDSRIPPDVFRRLPSGLALSLPVALAALSLRQVTRAGAAAGTLVAAILWSAAGWQGWLQLGATFAIAAGATRIGRPRNEPAGLLDEDAGRGWRSVVANTGVAAAAAFAMAGRGPGFVPVVVAAALATACADTAASEIGKAYGGAPVSLASLRRVTPGTPGAVSAVGIGASAAAAAGSALIALTAGWLTAYDATAVAGAAVVASTLEGWVSAAAESRGWLDNDGVNFAATMMGAALAVLLHVAST